MQSMKFGRKVFSFNGDGAVLKSTSVTEKAMPDEDEAAFTRRLVERYKGREGTIEVVFKRGRPDYAIITFSRRRRE
jgi:hypothetical protein